MIKYKTDIFHFVLQFQQLKKDYNAIQSIIQGNQGQYKQIANQTQMAMKHETSIGILEDEIREMKVYIYLVYNYQNKMISILRIINKNTQMW